MVLGSGLLGTHPMVASAAPVLVPAGCDSATLEMTPWQCTGNSQDQTVAGTTVSVYTGDNPAAVPPNVASDPVVVNPAKIESAANLHARTLEALASAHAGLKNVCPDGGCPPTRLLTGQPLTWQETNYSCGPSATRLVVWQIMRVDNGEQTYFDYEGTRAGYGTNIVGVERGLNRDVPPGEKFGLVKPSEPTDLLNWVVNDVYNYNSSLIEEINTSAFGYWNHTPSHHFNIIYGYDLNYGQTGKLFLAEEFGGSYSWGSPYGYREVSTEESFAAIQGGWNQEIVA